MELLNKTQFEAGWTLGFEKDGRELIVVAIKGTFDIPKDGEQPALSEQQIPLTESDEFTGEPGLSATLYESDYAHRKPKCDVLLNGCAYSPRGKLAERVTVALQVGRMKKAFDVVGDRVWSYTLNTTRIARPKPFQKMPISYDRAYGGVDALEKRSEEPRTYLANPVGVGYYPLTRGRALAGKHLPNTEERGKEATTPSGKYRPMAFGPMGRNFEARVRFAGKYDQEWLDHRAPFWPDDFDYRYFQAAPLDQQIDYPVGGEQVVLHNLGPTGLIRFALPKVRVPVIFIPQKGEDVQMDAVIDTLVLEPDEGRFAITWRAALPLRQNCFEIKQMIAGEMPRAWHRARAGGKRYYKGLGEFVASRRSGRW